MAKVDKDKIRSISRKVYTEIGKCIAPDLSGDGTTTLHSLIGAQSGLGLAMAGNLYALRECNIISVEDAERLSDLNMELSKGIQSAIASHLLADASGGTDKVVH